MEQAIIRTEKTNGRYWQRKVIFILTALVAGVCIDSPGFFEGVRIGSVEWTSLVLLICGAMISVTILWRLSRDHSSQAAAWLLTSAGAGLFFLAFLIIKVGAGAAQATWWSVVLLAVAGVIATIPQLDGAKIWRWAFLLFVLVAWILPVRLYTAQNPAGGLQNQSTLASYEQAGEQSATGMSESERTSIVPASNSLHPAIVSFSTVQNVLYSQNKNKSSANNSPQQACPGNQPADSGSISSPNVGNSQISSGTSLRSLIGCSGPSPRS